MKKNTLLFKNLLLTLALLLTISGLSLSSSQDVYATERTYTEIGGVYYELENLNYFEYYKDNMDSNKYNYIVSLINTYGGVYRAYCEDGASFNGTKLDTITIENTINNIPVVFVEVEDTIYTVKNLNIPANVVEFHPSYWENLTSLSVSPDNQFYSENEGILYDKGQTKIIAFINATVFNVPSTVTTLPTRYPSSIKAINVSNTNKKYSSKDGVLYNKKKTEVIYYPMGKTSKIYKMPKTVKTLPISFMSNQQYVEKIILSDKITKIPSNSFSNMKKLKTVTLPKKLKMIDGYSFNDCPKLKKVTIPATCKKILRAFDNCKSLKTVTLKSKSVLFNLDFGTKQNYTLVIKKGTTIHFEYNSVDGISCKQSQIFSVKKNSEWQYTAKALNTGKATLIYSGNKMKVKVVK